MSAIHWARGTGTQFHFWFFVCICSHNWQFMDKHFSRQWSLRWHLEGELSHFFCLLNLCFYPQVLETVRNTVADDRVKIDVVEAFDPLPVSPWDDQTFGVHIFQRTILDIFPAVDSVVPGNSKHVVIIVSSPASTLLVSPPSPVLTCFHFLCISPPQLLTAGNSCFFLFLFSSLWMFYKF